MNLNRTRNIMFYSAWGLLAALLPVEAAASPRGDFNRDGWVDITDLLIIADQWLASDMPGCPGDITGDCFVDYADFGLLSAHWQTFECGAFTAAASSRENASLDAANVLDGTLTTRWASTYADNQWLLLDLGQIRTVFGLQIYWENAYALRYTIETSADGANWTAVYTQNSGAGGYENISFPQVQAHYVRLNCIQRATQWGFSIYEVFVKTNDACLSAGAWDLVWSDEFTEPAINTANWTFETGTGSQGWGNWEWQYYTSRPQNARIENDTLVIEARRENYGGRNFTSARLKTQGKRAFQYGRIEASIKMPTGGHGIWPAFWMLGSNFSSVGWPKCGEIDIVEMMSNSLTDNRKAIAAMHFAGPTGSHTSYSGSRTIQSPLSSQFRTYAIEWDATGIRWSLDGVTYFARTSWSSSEGPFPAPYEQPFFIILNFAVGSHWWDQNTTLDTVPFPQTMQVDYVRVYRKNE